MNILITGANGQLGNEMRIVAKTSSDKYLFTDVNQVEGQETTYLDITDLDAIRAIVKANDINVIVNCAAWTNVDACETDEKLAALAEKLNADAPENLATAMRESGGLLIQISTELHGEQKIIATGCKHVIIRTAWLYSEFGKNFCKTMLNLTAAKPALKVVFDQAGTPTYAYDLALAIEKVMDDYKAETVATGSETYSKTGVYHFSNEGVCSWYDFTKMIQHLSGQNECDVQPCHSDEFPSPVTRPSYSVLDKTKIKEVFGVKVPYWTDSLQTCIKNLKS